MLKRSNLFTSLLLLIVCLCALNEAHAQRKKPSKRTAIIKGELSYPGEGIPPELVICAENLKTANVLCRGTYARNRQYDLRYELEVPPGSYFIFATLPYDSEESMSLPVESRIFRAYYSEYVKCMKANENRNHDECSSHTPIRVTVRAGQTISGIDPGDWDNH